MLLKRYAKLQTWKPKKHPKTERRKHWAATYD
jgi:hypothetical protein